MPEQKTNYMSQLDEWTDENIIFPVAEAATRYFEENTSEYSKEEMISTVQDHVKKMVREKVLESYRNGQAAKPKDRSWKK